MGARAGWLSKANYLFTVVLSSLWCVAAPSHAGSVGPLLTASLAGTQTILVAGQPFTFMGSSNCLDTGAIQCDYIFGFDQTGEFLPMAGIPVVPGGNSATLVVPFSTLESLDVNSEGLHLASLTVQNSETAFASQNIIIEPADTVPIPISGTLSLLGLGLAGLGFSRRRRT